MQRQISRLLRASQAAAAQTSQLSASYNVCCSSASSTLSSSSCPAGLGAVSQAQQQQQQLGSIQQCRGLSGRPIEFEKHMASYKPSGRREREGPRVKLSENIQKMKEVFFKYQMVPEGAAQAISLIEGLMQEAMREARALRQRQAAEAGASSSGVVGLTVPEVYRMDMELMDSYFRLLTSNWLPGQRYRPARFNEAQEVCSKMEQAFQFMDACGLQRLPRQNASFMRLLKDAGRAAEALKVYDMVKDQRNVGNEVHLTAVHCHSTLGNWDQAQRILDPLLSGGGLLPHQRSQLQPLLERMLLGAARKRDFEAAQGMLTRLAKLGLQASPAAYTELLVGASNADEIGLATSTFLLLDGGVLTRELGLDYLQRQGGGSSTATRPVKFLEGSLLPFMRACLRAGTPDNLKHVKQAFQLLQRSMEASNFHPPRYYEALTGAPLDPPNQPPPVPEAVRHPSPAAYHLYIEALAAQQDWAGAFEAVHLLGQAHGAASPAALSPFDGLRPLVAALRGAQGAHTAAAYAKLSERYAGGQPVSCCMFNCLLRALALDGLVDEAGRLFEEFKVLGLAPDVESFNAIMESCVVAGKAGSIEPLLDYMISQGVAPDLASYDLLLRGHIAAGDLNEVCAALARMERDGARAKVTTLMELKKTAEATLQSSGAHSSTALSLAQSLLPAFNNKNSMYLGAVPVKYLSRGARK